MKNYLALGNAGVLINGCIVSNNPQPCPRKIYARANNLEEPIDERALVTFALGRALEEVFAQQNPKWKTSYRLDEMLKPFEMFPEFGIGLEADAVLKNPDGTIKAITELKSVSSTNIYKEVFCEGHYKHDNLVQLCSYLTYLGVETGYLLYTSVLYHNFTFAKKDIKAKAGDKKGFTVKHKDGVFYVDGEKTFISVESITNFGQYIACVLEGSVDFQSCLIPISVEAFKGEKPKTYTKGEDIKHISCQYCSLRSVCLRATNWEEFLELAQIDGVLKPKLAR